MIAYIINESHTYETNFDDQILAMDWNESGLESDGLKNYKAKAEFYIRQHQDDAVIAKLKTNQRLTPKEVLDLSVWAGIRKVIDGINANAEIA